MRSLLAALTLLLTTTQVAAACPDYMNHEFRKLHSKESVNLCTAFPNQPMLVINTASHCGFTSQFKELEGLHKAFKEQGLVVVGFASNDFRQEADDEAEAADVCFVNYGVTFTMIAPSHVKGDKANPVFAALAQQSTAPAWNFNKYLIDRDGKVVQHFGSTTKPDSAELKAAIERLF